uniref:Crossover junction endonuclease MUS81 n=1 Tax=Strongyloides venezuelensis TaxID=75913 RepID=A0A0K0G076_STRVS
MENSDDDCVILDVIDQNNHCKPKWKNIKKFSSADKIKPRTTNIVSNDVIMGEKNDCIINSTTNFLKNVNILSSDIQRKDIHSITNDDTKNIDMGNKQVLKKIPSKRKIKEINEGDNNGGTETEAQKKKRLRMEAKEAQRVEKEINKIKREISASINTKAEQYLYCRVSRRIIDMIPEFKGSIETFFEGRQIKDQLEFEHSTHNIITWRRKNIDALVENNTVQRVEMFDLENTFLLILPGEEFKNLHITNELITSIDSVKRQFNGEMQGVVIVYEKHSINKPTLYSLCLEVFEKTGVQIKFIKSIEKLILTVAQHHRAIARRPLSLEKNVEGMMIYNGEKGVKDGPDLHKDWWYKMLSAIHRINEDQKRAVIDHYPNPFELINLLHEIGAYAVVKRISNIQCENGRKIGSIFAQKLVQTLSSVTGDEIIEC